MNINVQDIDKIIKTLSTKFRRIFYDREFVCCVQEDLQVLLKNRDKCCVVVFPLLGPNYLKAVQYQANIFDLEVFTLGSGKICSLLAVCDKKFLTKKSEESEEQIMPNNEQENGAGSTLKKKRPERQLYIPPAQRRLPITELPISNNPKIDNVVSSSKGKKRSSTSIRKKEPPKKVKNATEFPKEDPESSLFSEDSIKDAIIDKVSEITDFSYMWWKYELFEPSCSNIYKNVFTKSFKNKNLLYNLSSNSYKLFNIETVRTLYILNNDYLLWQPKVDVFMNSKESDLKVIPLTNLDQSDVKDIVVNERTPLSGPVFLDKSYSELLEEFSIYCDVDVFLMRKNVEPRNLLNVCCNFYYLIDDYCDVPRNIEELIEYLLPNEDDNEKEKIDISRIENVEKQVPEITKNETTNEFKNERNENVEAPFDNDSHLQKNNLKNNTPNTNFSYFKNTINISENVKMKNDLEEEKEIMRKTKENINRKTRPIMKYVDDTNDTLKIDKNDINNWEDLFDEEGQLQEDLLKEIVHKVGNEVTIVKAKEDYSDYFTKHVNIEELEHMVELYDFPPTLETHDLIHAFNEVKSDAMYVKWVDDTHAILVLGSSSQAQKAINVQNPLIKVRPMTAASKSSLSTAYRNDLKPAMKRPPTNLQTARRLITSHLGTKSGISKEKSAKERDDLKAAREMKKLVKKNEQDAWDGNLRSSIN